VITHTGYELIRYYLQRRRETVIQALLEMRPDLVVSEGLHHVFDVPNLASQIAQFLERYQQKQLKFRGRWGDTWHYNLHGTGCELIHDLTGELFDWDMSNPLVFTKTEFECHLKWRCKQDNLDEFLKNYLDWMNDTHTNSEFWAYMENSGMVHSINEYEVRITHDQHTRL
jgi:hypothetical protein